MSYVTRWTPTVEELRACRNPDHKMIYWGIEAQDPKVEDEPLAGQRRYCRIYWFGYEPTKKRLVEGYSRGVSSRAVTSVEELICRILGGRVRKKKESIWQRLIVGPEPEEDKFTIIQSAEMTHRKVLDVAEGVTNFVKPEKLDVIVMYDGLTDEEIKNSNVDTKKFVPMPYALKY